MKWLPSIKKKKELVRAVVQEQKIGRVHDTQKMLS